MDDKTMLNNMLLSGKELDKSIILKIIPELKICDGFLHEHPAHIYDVLTHIFKVVDGVDSNIIVKLTALFHDIGKPEAKRNVNGVCRYWYHETISERKSRPILQRLGYDNDTIEKVCILIKYHDIRIVPTKSSIQNVIDKVGIELMPYLLNHQEADLNAHSKEYIDKKTCLLKDTKKVYEQIVNSL